MPKKGILCVDDEKIVLTSLKGQLRNHFQNEYALEFAESGPEALDLADELVKAGINLLVVISDWLMPGMKGDEFLVRLHAKFPEVRTVLLTGQADASAIDRATREASLFRYLPKPWDESSLIETIKAGVAS